MSSVSLILSGFLFVFRLFLQATGERLFYCLLRIYCFENFAVSFPGGQGPCLCLCYCASNARNSTEHTVGCSWAHSKLFVSTH